MSIDFEQRLRADMGRVEVRPRAGLAREAHRRYRKGHRRTALAIAATGTAAAVVGATVGFALTAGSSGTEPIETTAYVVNRVGSSRLTGPGALGTARDPIDAWQFGGRCRRRPQTSRS